MTVLNRLLREGGLHDRAVVVNEPGVVGIGHLPVELSANTVVEVPRLAMTIPGAGSCPPALARARKVLEGRYQRRDESIRLAWYRDGRASVAMHDDRIGRRIADTVVAILSLGAARRFLFKSATGGRSLRFDLGGGDLLVMGGSCQRIWRHSIPKVKSAEPRISIRLRDRREYA